MRQLWNRMFGPCEHPYTLVISSVGVRRTVCEQCGHISFDMSDNITQVSKVSPAAETADLQRVSGL